MRGRGGCRRAAAAAVCLLAAAGVLPRAAAAAEGSPAVARVGEAVITAADLAGYLGLRPSRAADPAAFEEAVRGRLEEMVLAEVLYLEGLRRGIDREPAVRQTIRQAVAGRLLGEEVDRPVAGREVTEEELRAYYEAHRGEYHRPAQVRLADIFFAAPTGGDALRDEKRAAAEKVLAEARALQDTRFGFGELVLAHSETHGKYPRGDTGFFDREGAPAGIDPALAGAAFAIGRVGAVADRVVEEPAGFHVVMLVGRRDAVDRSFEEIRGELDGRLRADERRRLREELLARLRALAEIAVDEEALRRVVDEAAPAPAPAAETGAAEGAAAPPSLPVTAE